MTRSHPAPPEVQAAWRALGAWTDETLLDRFASVDGTGLAVVDGDTRLTVADLRSSAAALAGALWELGVRPGSVVAWQLPNWWEGVAVCWAAWRCGAIVSPITPNLRAREVGFILAQSDATVVVVPQVFRGTDYPALVRATGFGGTLIEVRGAAPLPTSRTCPVVDVHVDDPAVILWTSGTTSDPKGVVHTHQSLRVEADTIAAAHDMHAGESLLLPMPITHVAGLTYGVLLPVTSAITAILMDTWDPRRALEVVERERIAVMISTPVFLRTMIDDPTFEDTDRSSLRLFSLGGAGVAPAMVNEGAHAFGCWCKRTYGSTEYPTLTTGRLGDDLALDATTDGCIIGAAELRIVDPETLLDRASGDSGELLVRGPEMFVGYLDPVLDGEAFTAGGWFRTGDLACFRDEHLTIVDRLKDVIIRGGENISAQEVEAALATHAGVAEAACVAAPDPVMGEEVCAFVLTSGEVKPTLEELRAHLVAQGLARFKLPSRLELRHELPRTASGKVQKARLRAELNAGHDE